MFIYILLAELFIFIISAIIYTYGIDSTISNIAISIHSTLFYTIMKILTLLGTPLSLLIFSIIISIILLKHKLKKELLFYWIAIILNTLITSFIKNIIKRERPLHGMENIDSYSFPSWHASSAMALSVAIILILASKDSKYRWWILIWGVSVGCSRVYLNVHWCSDVLAGWGIGALISTVTGYLILKKF